MEETYEEWFTRVYREEPLADEEFEKLYDEVSDLVVQRGGVDEDGDQRIQVILVSRDRNESNRFFALPNLNMGCTVEEAYRYLDLATGNLNMANEQIRRGMINLKYAKGSPVPRK